MSRRERESRIAGRMKQELNDRQEFRLEREGAEWEDLNVGALQTGTYAIRRPGIRWGPSYRVRTRVAGPKKGRNDPPGDALSGTTPVHPPNK